MTNINTTLINLAEARSLALAEARVDSAVFTSMRLTKDAGRAMYELSYYTDEMDYVLYLDAATGETLGFMSEPTAA